MERENRFASDMTQVILLALASLFWDVFVLYYHAVNAPHPKFRLRPSRRLSIYTHIFSGMTEIVISVVSFAMYNGDDAEGVTSDRTLVVYIHVFCACMHTLT
eukprot:SAG31_NODE_17043_length_685_cov_1.373720_1_plen_101_part_10